MASGCEIINPEEGLPVRIEIKPFDFQVQSGQGSNRNQFTETWVFANSNFLGAFPPESTINYLQEGPTTFVFRPGIRNNGILNDAISYPMVTGYTINQTVAAGDVVTINPVTAYQPEIVVSLWVDFEQSNPYTNNRDTLAASQLVLSTEDVFEGNQSGLITLDTAAFFIEVGHAVPMSGLPVDGKTAYLELWYKSEIEFSIGLLGTNLGGESFSNFFYLVRPTAEWNMLYIDLTEFLEVSGFPAYTILFRSLYPSSAQQAAYRVYLDNIKVVHL